MIIDIHAHTSNHKLWNFHVPTATIEDLEEQAKLYGIYRIFLMATYFPFKQSGVPNMELLSRISGHPLFGMFGSLDLTANFQKGIAELKFLLKEEKIQGIKLYFGYQDAHPADSAIFPVYQIAEQFQVPIMCHGGELHHCCPPEQRKKGQLRCTYKTCPLDKLTYLSKPNQFTRAVAKFPKVKFIISHLANDYFDELRELMFEFPNVYTDISGQFVSGSGEDTPNYKKQIVQEIREFLALPEGKNRLLFGSDFPIQSYEDSIALVNALGLSKEDEENIFYKNALNLLEGRRNKQ